MNDFTGTVFKFLIKALVLFTALPVHECAHAWAADKLGDPTGRYQGRISLNPFVHLDLFGSICMILTGFGWAKPVQVNANNFRNRKWGMAITSLAGPMANVLMAWVSMIIYKLISYGFSSTNSSFMYYLAFIFSYMVILNIGLAIFNLLPIPPLDGSRILTLILPERIYFQIMRYERYIFIALILIMFSGILNPVLTFLRQIVYYALDFLTGFVDIIMRAI